MGLNIKLKPNLAVKPREKFVLFLFSSKLGPFESQNKSSGLSISTGKIQFESNSWSDNYAAICLVLVITQREHIMTQHYIRIKHGSSLRDDLCKA